MLFAAMFKQHLEVPAFGFISSRGQHRSTGVNIQVFSAGVEMFHSQMRPDSPNPEGPFGVETPSRQGCLERLFLIQTCCQLFFVLVTKGIAISSKKLLVT